MKNLNLIKRLCTDSHEKQSPQRFARYAAMLIMLLTLGVGQMWAGAGYWGSDAVVLKYWLGGDDIEYKHSSSSTTKDLGTVTSFYLKHWEFRTWKDGSGNICDYGRMYYRIYLTSASAPAYSYWSQDGTSWDRNNQYHYKDCNNNILSGLGGGRYYLEYYFVAQGNTSSSSGCGTNITSNTFKIQFTIDPVVTFKANGGTGSDYTQTVTYNTNTALTANTFTKTGYDFAGWATSADGSVSYADGANIKRTSNIDLYAKWTEKTYSLTFSHNGHGSIAVGGSTVASGSTASVNYSTTKTLVATPSTGYNFSGWTKSGTNTSAVTIGNASNASTTIKATNTGATVTAGFTAKTYSITLDGNGGSDGSATATYNSSTLTSVTGSSRPSYDLNGYFTATSGGTKVINANGTLVTSAGSYTNSSSQWIYDGAVKLHAQWTYNPVTYSVTYAVGTSYTSLGSISATNNTESASITSGDDVVKGTSITFTATPNTGYVVEGWYTDAACTVGNRLQVGGDTYTVASLSSNLTVYVKFKLIDYTITYKDQGDVAYSGNNLASLTPTSYNYGTGVASFVAGTKTGYTFGGWYTNSTCTEGPVTSISSTDSGDKTLYAKWTVKNYAITYSPASAPIGAVYTTTPANADYGSTVNLTIDRWAGYRTSVSVKDEDDGDVTVTNATSRTPSFTMPAKSVTVTVTATKINKPIVYVLKTQVAAGSNIENFSTVSSDADNVLFWGWGNGGTDNFYTSSATWNSNVQLSDARVGTYIDEHGNTWYEFISNRSTFNLSTEYLVILRLKDTRNLYESNADHHWVDGTEYNGSTNTYFKGITWIVPNGYTEHSAQLYTSNPDGVIRASIASVDLSLSRVPPMAEITATPSMYYKGATDKAYCWAVYSDEECTIPVNVSFNSLGAGKVQFMAPQTQGTYYLKLTVHSSDDCNVTIDDEEVVSFTVTTDDMVFFKNVPGWGNVHFYFLGGEYWDNDKGAGCAGRDGGAARGMTRIGNSDVYYYDYSNNSVMTTYLSSHSTCYIAFTDNYKPNSNNFSECQAVYRGDFSECAAMFVPENWITHYLNNAAYYNRGYWTNYMSASSGFKLYIWDKTANNADGEHQILATDVLTSSVVGGNTYTYEYDFGDDPYNSETRPYTYGFKFEGCGGSWYGAEDDMNITKCTDWNLGTDTRKCGISVTVNQKHKFILTLAGDGHVQVSVEYPVSIGDYRLLYDDNTQTPHPSQYIRKRADGKDTVAMFIRPSAATKTLKVQRCSGVDGETITWVDYNWNSGSPDINISSISEDGVYNFYLEQNGSGNLTVNTSETKSYSGKYYIRTNCLDGGWNSYKTSDDNLMTYAQYPEDKGYGFNYYKAKWVGSTGTDVTYTIACDFSPALCDTLVADEGNNPLSASEAASLPHAANIRFGWHSKTNKLKRAYINGSTNVADRFLVMIGDAKMKDKDNKALAISGLNANEISFTDLNNWIYRCDITAREGAAVRLTANYDTHIQYFIGSSETPETIIGGSGSKDYLMRVTYDFKTNRLMTAWLPNGSAIDENMTLKADMMLIREGQNAATQVYFGESHKDKTISEIKTIFGVMEFQYDHIAGKFPSWSSPNAYKYLMYYLSFPFDVKVSEIFGCGVRGTNWIIQKYNGARRAQIGWFAETSTFWETLPGDSTLHANEGYLLLLDRISFNDPSSSIWYKQGSGNSVYLYFPSVSNSIGTIKDANEEVTIKIPSHTCTIERPFTPDIDGWSGGELVHSNTDSHWNVFGIPLFQSKAATTVGDSELKYFYSWNYTDNTLRPQVTLAGDTVFKSMHGYMVQFAGDVTFTGAHISASVAARRMPSNKHYLAELQLVNENGDENATYVELRENANTDFQLNEDMYMMRSSNTVDLYSFAGAYDVAANVLPIDDQLVRVGVDVKRAGTYRFTMPSEFSGTVTLIDNLMGTRTNMALGDHEVYLERGVDNNRFQLEIDIQQMPTAIDGVGGSLKDGKAHKFIENGQMYILNNGVIYDATGRRVE